MSGDEGGEMNGDEVGEVKGGKVKETMENEGNTGR